MNEIAEIFGNKIPKEILEYLFAFLFKPRILHAIACCDFDLHGPSNVWSTYDNNGDVIYANTDPAWLQYDYDGVATKCPCASPHQAHINHSEPNLVRVEMHERQLQTIGDTKVFHRWDYREYHPSQTTNLTQYFVGNDGKVGKVGKLLLTKHLIVATVGTYGGDVVFIDTDTGTSWRHELPENELPHELIGNSSDMLIIAVFRKQPREMDYCMFLRVYDLEKKTFVE